MLRKDLGKVRETGKTGGRLERNFKRDREAPLGEILKRPGLGKLKRRARRSLGGHEISALPSLLTWTCVKYVNLHGVYTTFSTLERTGASHTGEPF